MVEVNYNAIYILTVVYAVVIGLFNLFIIFGIIINPVLRRSIKHVLILVLAVLSLVAGGYTNSLTAYYYYNLAWDLDCKLYLSIECVGYTAQSIIVLMISIISLEYCMWKKEVAPRTRVITAVVLTIIAWVGSAVIVNFLLIKGQRPGWAKPGVCFDMKLDFDYALNSVYLIPGALLMIVMVIIAIATFKSHRDSVPQFTADSVHHYEDNTAFPVDILFVTIVAFVFMVPLAIMFIGLYKFPQTEAYPLIYQIIGRLGMVPYFMIPLIWLSNKFTRREIGNSICCRTSSQDKYMMK